MVTGTLQEAENRLSSRTETVNTLSSRYQAASVARSEGRFSDFIASLPAREQARARQLGAKRYVRYLNAERKRAGRLVDSSQRSVSAIRRRETDFRGSNNYQTVRSAPVAPSNNASRAVSTFSISGAQGTSYIINPRPSSYRITRASQNVVSYGGRSVNISPALAAKIERDNMRSFQTNNNSFLSRQIISNTFSPTVSDTSLIAPASELARQRYIMAQNPPRPAVGAVVGSARGLPRMSRGYINTLGGVGSENTVLNMGFSAVQRFGRNVSRRADPFTGAVITSVTEQPARTLRDVGFGVIAGGAVGGALRVPNVSRAVVGGFARAAPVVSSPVVVGTAQAGVLALGAASVVYPRGAGRFVGRSLPSAAGFGLGFSAVAPRPFSVPIGDARQSGFAISRGGSQARIGGTVQQTFLTQSRFGVGSRQYLTTVQPFSATLRGARGAESVVRFGRPLTVYPSGFSVPSGSARSFTGFVRTDLTDSVQRGLFDGSGSSRFVSDAITSLQSSTGRNQFFMASTGRAGFRTSYSKRFSGFQNEGFFVGRQNSVFGGSVAGRIRSPTYNPVNSGSLGFGSGSLVSPRSTPQFMGSNVNIAAFSAGLPRALGAAGFASVGFSSLFGAGSSLGSSFFSSPRSVSSPRFFLSAQNTGLGFDSRPVSSPRQTFSPASIFNQPAQSVSSSLVTSQGLITAQTPVSVTVPRTPTTPIIPVPAFPAPPVAPPVAPPAALLPAIPNFFTGQTNGRRGRRGRGYRYNPSLIAVFGGGRRGRVTPITGLEIRGV